MGTFIDKDINCTMYQHNYALTSVGDWTILRFSQKISDTKSSYATSTGVWTCPSTGVYSVTAKISPSFSGSGLWDYRIAFFIGNTNISWVMNEQILVATSAEMPLVLPVQHIITQGDLCTIKVKSNGGNIVNDERNALYIHRIASTYRT